MKIDKNLNRTTIRAAIVITGLMANINDRNIKRKNSDGIDTTRPNNIIKVISSGVYFLSDFSFFSMAFKTFSTSSFPPSPPFSQISHKATSTPFALQNFL